ncbi:MAG: hypothetical protein AAF512_06925 [Pseudomonadota bacterium]
MLRFSQAICLIIGLLAPLYSLPANTQHQYENLVVFQRFDNNAATPDIPGFYGGASIWVMEADGSHPKLLRTSGDEAVAKHLDHPSITSDGRYVIYSEFENAKLGFRGIARLYKEDLHTGQREILREKAGCALHHAALSLDDKDLTYAQHCKTDYVMVTEIDGVKRSVEPDPSDSFVGNGISAGRSVVYQNEIRSPGQKKRTMSIVLTSFDEKGERQDRSITTREYRNRRPAISMDGQLVAWQTNSTTKGGTDDILLLDVSIADATPQRLTKSAANDGHPWFSRDSQWLLFESDRSGNWEIYKMHIPTRSVTQLTDDKKYVSTRPRW